MKRLLYTLVTFASLAAAQPSRDNAWRQDLDQLATQLPRLHPNLFYYSPRDVFDREVANLRDDIPSLSDSDVIIRMAAIVALTHDAHTAIYLSQRPADFRALPLSFQWFEDGLFVTGAGAAYPRAGGAKVLRIGGRTTDEAYEAVKRIISHDTDNWAREISPAYLANADVLRVLGIAPAGDSVWFELLDRTGERFEMEVASLERGQAPALRTFPDASAGSAPLYRQNRNQNYWFTYIESTRTLYFAYNQCAEMASLPFAQFNSQLWTTFDERPVERFVMDLRNNTGGSSSVINPFLQSGMARAARLEGIRMALIIGRRTISSGLMGAIDLHNGPVVSYGEPTGGSSSHYGQVSTLTLAHSGLTIGYSTKYFAYPSLSPGSVLPDVGVPVYSSDYFGRHDPFLAAALADARRTPAPGTIAVVNGASFRGPVAPGSIASAFGAWDEGAGVEVDGIAADVFAAVPGQINFRVPPETRVGLATVRIGSSTGTMRVVERAPGLFAAAARDGWVELYGTGEGRGGEPAVYAGNERVELLYSGAHPQFPGLWQVNARLPAGAGVGESPVFVTLGGSASNAVTIQIGN